MKVPEEDTSFRKYNKQLDALMSVASMVTEFNLEQPSNILQ